jgi:hypothetical protein
LRECAINAIVKDDACDVLHLLHLLAIELAALRGCTINAIVL